MIGVSMMEPSGFAIQTTHTSQLTNLCRRTTRTGVGHHVDAVEGNLLLF